MEKLVFFDLETGGLNPGRPVIQMAAIAVDQDLNEIEAIEMKIRFNESDCTKRALKKNGYDPLIWKADGLPRKKAAKPFADFLRRHATVRITSKRNEDYLVAQLVAHNAGFDGSFLHAWYKSLGKFCPARYHVFCTLQRSLWYAYENFGKPPRNYQLQTLCEYFGIPFNEDDAHDALYDVRATVQLYRHLVFAANNQTIERDSRPIPLKRAGQVLARISPVKVPADQAIIGT